MDEHVHDPGLQPDGPASRTEEAFIPAHFPLSETERREVRGFLELAHGGMILEKVESTAVSF
jgi:hypothetical protein